MRKRKADNRRLRAYDIASVRSVGDGKRVTDHVTVAAFTASDALVRYAQSPNAGRVVSVRALNANELGK